MKNFVKSLLLLALFTIIGSSCGVKENGQLIGVLDRPTWKGINPYGMVYIPSGTFHVGPSDQDVAMTMMQRSKSVSIQGFYMDDTEITNNEYRQFINWVRDSLAHTLIGNLEEDDYGNETIDWTVELDWEDETLEDLYYPEDERLNGKKELDPRQMKFKYQWYNYKKAAHGDRWANRNDYIEEDETLIMPDELCWVRDFTYAYNDPMTRQYFSHPAFDDYPIVGVTWKQAKAFAAWRTKLWNMYSEDGVISEDFRLPTEFEWEYAARGGNEHAPYPWGGYYLRNNKGCLLANFKPGRGNYPEDGGLYTVATASYFANDYGLYDMAGNVAEWTESAFHRNSYSFVHDMNSTYIYNAEEEDPTSYKLKVVRGGSWKDVAFYLQNSTRSYEYQDTSKSYIGFRCALTFLGRSLNDFKK